MQLFWSINKHIYDLVQRFDITNMVAVGGIVYFPTIFSFFVFKFTFSIKHMYKYADGLDIGVTWDLGWSQKSVVVFRMEGMREIRKRCSA